jgi:aryl-alcohol dehydrogenase-like predicted oxidoreductase
MQKIILGTAQFGLDYGINNTTKKPSLRQVFEILDYAAEKRISILDTADAYGNASEILGEYNNAHPGTFLINTKFKLNEITLSEQFESSILRLRTNYINVYFYHSFEDFINYPSIQPQLEELKKEGKIAKVGISVYDNSQFRSAIDSTSIDVIQLPFNLLDNYSQRGELMKIAKMYGKELQIRSIFLQGLFFKSTDDLPIKLAPLKPYLKKIKELSEESKVSVEQMAFSYALNQPDISHIIIGIDNLDQLRHNLSLKEGNLTCELLDKIDQILVRETELLNPKNWN